MKIIDFENGEILFFPTLKEDSTILELSSKKNFYTKLAEYVKDNGLSDVYFTYQVCQNGLVTVLCHNPVDEDASDVFFVGMMSGKKWVRFGWWTKGDTLSVSFRDGVVHFPAWLEEKLKRMK